MNDWQPGDVANGHILGEDLIWQPIQNDASIAPVYPRGAPEPPSMGTANTLATVSLVAGIIALLLNVCFIPSVVAVVTGVVALGRAKQMDGLGTQKACWGIGTGVAGIFAGIALAFLLFGVDMDGLTPTDTFYSSDPQYDPDSPDIASSCDLARESFLTGTQDEIEDALAHLQADTDSPEVAREYADYYLHRDAGDEQQREMDKSLIRSACN